jgi:ABC-type glycerol-3-phosphate transport system permease component
LSGNLGRELALFHFPVAPVLYDPARALDDSARIDGCSTWGILLRIILPLSKPALAMVAVFAFIGNWNNFMGPLIYLRDEDKYTLALALQHFATRVGVVTHARIVKGDYDEKV